jgi:hypothetical protein
MTDMIDGPMLVGIAALITRITNVVTPCGPANGFRSREGRAASSGKERGGRIAV